MKERNLNADLIRCAAVYSVLSVHFLKNNGFYGMPTEGIDMLLMCMFRSLFMVCVPLFMILTGFLMWQKTLSGRYYKGLGKTLEIYFLACVSCLLFKKFVMGYQVTFKSSILGILDFSAANYAWYVEMYISLFLIIPFLNLAYHGLRSKREKQILVFTMMALTLLPKLLNNFDLVTEGWWASPGISKDYNDLVPGFFTAMYPITYYFIGAYLREFDWKISKWKNLLLLILAVAAFGWYNFYRSDGGSFVWGLNSTWGGENLITAVLVFVLLLHLRPQRWPRFIQGAMIYISKISLGIYLISWIFDEIIYKVYFNPYVEVVNERWKYYPLVVGAVFLSSVGGASLLYLIQAARRKITNAIKIKYSHDGQ